MEKDVSLKIASKSSKASSICISDEMQRLYRVATFTLQYAPEAGDDVSIIIGDTTFDGFVYRATKQGKNIWDVECRSYTARLTSPFDYETDGVEAVTTATELMALFAQRAGVTIVYESEELFFGNGYQRSGSMLDEVLAVAAVTGSLVYCVDSNSIVITPNVGIVAQGKGLTRGDYYDFLPLEIMLESGAVGEVIITDGIGTVGYKATFNVNSCGEYTIKANFEVKKVNGSILPPALRIEPLLENHNVSPKTKYIETEALIERINAVYLNGMRTSAYEAYVNTTVIKLKAPLEGVLTIDYEGKIWRGELAVKETDLGQAHEGEVVSPEGSPVARNFTLRDCNHPPSTIGKCVLKSEENGKVVYATGGMLPKFYEQEESGYKETTIGYHNEGEVEYYITGTDNLAQNDPDHPGYLFVKLVPVPVRIEEFSSDNDNEYVLEGDHLRWPANYKHVRFTYATLVNKYLLDPPDDKSIKMTMKSNDKNCKDSKEIEIGKKASDPSNLHDLPCKLPQKVPVNIASNLGVDVNQVANKEFPVSNGQTLAASASGFIKIDIDSDGEYTINCDSVRYGARIILKVNTGERS